MTILEAIEKVLSMAKAELDDAREEMDVEAANDMEEAVTMVDGWIIGIKLGDTSTP